MRGLLVMAVLCALVAQAAAHTGGNPSAEQLQTGWIYELVRHLTECAFNPDRCLVVPPVAHGS